MVMVCSLALASGDLCGIYAILYNIHISQKFVFQCEVRCCNMRGGIYTSGWVWVVLIKK